MLGALVGAGASLIGGLLGKSSTEKANAQNIRLQKQFAQEGIRWKVEDAKKAGIHPLYALGAQTHSFAPAVVGDTALPNAMAEAGQNIGRAIDAKRSGAERVDAYNKTVQDLTLTRMGLENELLASQIRTVNQAGHPPPLPGIVAAGRRISEDPNWSDAEEWQRRYGEPGEWLSAPFIMGADFKRNVVPEGGWTAADIQRALLAFADRYLPHRRLARSRMSDRFNRAFGE